jgi:hypothetical protein
MSYGCIMQVACATIEAIQVWGAPSMHDPLRRRWQAIVTSSLRAVRRAMQNVRDRLRKDIIRSFTQFSFILFFLLTMGKEKKEKKKMKMTMMKMEAQKEE